MNAEMYVGFPQVCRGSLCTQPNCTWHVCCLPDTAPDFRNLRSLQYLLRYRSARHATTMVSATIPEDPNGPVGYCPAADQGFGCQLSQRLPKAACYWDLRVKTSVVPG